MKKGKKIFLIVILILVAAIAALGVWQKNNIIAVYKTLTTSNEQLAAEIDKGKTELEDQLKKQYSSIISDFTAEQEAKLMKGEMSVDEAVAELTKRYETAKEQNKAKGDTPKKGDNSAKIDELIGDKVIELYSLKAYYLGQLGQMEAAVKKDYLAMPTEKRNLIGKQELVNKYMGTALGLMKQCDGQVAELISELKAGLKELSGDTSIIATIEAAYENEKALKKAYYLKLLEE